MNDFKKGLLVGMLIIVSCVSFMAKTEKSNDVGRFLLYRSFNPTNTSILVDTKNGNTYMTAHKGYAIRKSGVDKWVLVASVPNVSE